MNTTKIVNDYKSSIQREIDMKQKVLDDITSAMKLTEEFLLDNGYDQLTEEMDVIASVMSKILELENNIGIYEKDIVNIEESIKTLSNITKGIDPIVGESLKSKIKEIEEDIRQVKDKLSSTNEFLPAILNLQIVCPVCSGSTHINKKTCDYCAGVGVLGIEKILSNEKPAETNAKNENYSTYRIHKSQS